MPCCTEIGIALFQSTPPARGATQAYGTTWGFLNTFQSTPPARGATLSIYDGDQRQLISIHAPREGGDSRILSIRL